MMRSDSAFASVCACSTVSLFSFSPWATISEARVFASVIISAIRFSLRARLCRPSSPAASPSAICFCRVSIARISTGQIYVAQNQMKMAKMTACIASVKLMFMSVPWEREPQCRLLETGGDQRVGVREQHRDAQPDDKRCVNQSEQQEYLGLQSWDHFRLARRALEKA